MKRKHWIAEGRILLAGMSAFKHRSVGHLVPGGYRSCFNEIAVGEKDSAGRIVVGGDRCAPGFTSCVDGLARLNTDGSFDTAFGTGGMLTTAFTNNDLGYDFVLIQSDGSIVVVGESLDRTNPQQGDVALARYLVN
jgi:hypothetical protein